MTVTQKWLFPFVLILFLTSGLAQDVNSKQKKVDSILELLPNQKDSTLAMSYINMARLEARDYPPAAKYYLQKAKAIAEKVNNTSVFALLYYAEANYHNNISNLEKAEDLYLKAITEYKKIGDYKMLYSTYNNYGITSKNLGKIQQALDAYLMSRSYMEKYDYSASDLLNYLNNMAVLYAKMDNLKVSNEYYRKTENLAKKNNMDYMVEFARSNRATNMVKNKKYAKALKLYLGAIPVFEREGKIAALAEQYYLIGSTYLEMDSLPKALDNLDKSLALCKETGSKAISGMATQKMGEILFKKGDYTSALGEFQKSLVIAKETSNTIEIAEVYLNLSDTHEKLGNVTKAYEYRKRYFTVHDSIFNKESEQRLNDLQVQLKTEKSKQEIALQKKEIALLEEQKRSANLQRIGLIVGLITLTVLFGLIYYGIRQKMKRNRLERERVKSELAFKKKELTSYALHLAKKNEVLEGLKQKAAELKKREGGGAAYQEMIKTINFDQQDDKVWENFTQYFEAVHKDFAKLAMAKYPDITKNELRLMALMKMNLSSKEIANILNISSDGVKKARQRLRKKMDLSPDDSLETTVMAI